MEKVKPPAPNATTEVTITKFPVRLWWRLLEMAQQRGVGVNYLVLSILAQGVGFNPKGESYDQLMEELTSYLDQS